jgi:hypothetical protein
MLSLATVQLQGYVIATQPNGSITRTSLPPVDVTGDCFLGPVGLPFGFLIERLNGSFELGKRNVIVSGVYGAFSTIPGDITRAATRLAIHYMKQLDANYQNTVGATGLGAPTFTQDAPSDVIAILERRRSRVFRSR